MFAKIHSLSCLEKKNRGNKVPVFGYNFFGFYVCTPSSSPPIKSPNLRRILQLSDRGDGNLSSS